MEQWVLAQSLRVALEKWASNEDRFFVARDAEGYRIVRPRDMRAYLTYDPPRIDSSLQILQDLGLISWDWDEGGYFLTDMGAQLRDEGIAFHDERMNEASP